MVSCLRATPHFQGLEGPSNQAVDQGPPPSLSPRSLAFCPQFADHSVPGLNIRMEAQWPILLASVVEYYFYQQCSERAPVMDSLRRRKSLRFRGSACDGDRSRPVGRKWRPRAEACGMNLGSFADRILCLYPAFVPPTHEALVHSW